MTISVIIPNFNYGNYITTTIKSLLLQSYKDIEVIIVDDGSTDNSHETISRLKEEYAQSFVSFKTLLETKNAGKLAALNKAVKLVEGELVVILDSDDYLHPLYFKKAKDRLIAERSVNPNIGFVYTNCHLIDESGMILTEGKSSSFSKPKILANSYIPECALTLTEALQTSLPFDESILVGTKHHKWKRIIGAGWEGAYLNEPLFYYRMHTGNISGIGKRVLNDIYTSDTVKEKILSGLWPLERKEY